MVPVHPLNRPDVTAAYNENGEKSSGAYVYHKDMC